MHRMLDPYLFPGCGVIFLIYLAKNVYWTVESYSSCYHIYHSVGPDLLIQSRSTCYSYCALWGTSSAHIDRCMSSRHVIIAQLVA